MARYWSDRQLDRVTTPAAYDARGRAILRALDRLIGDRPLSEFYVRDADTCPADVLPALIAEWSMEEFIEPGLPEEVVRRILKQAWLLQRLKGTDAGVLLGLQLLGIDATITQWYETEPKGPANTHNIQIYVGEKLFEPDAEVFLGDFEVKAAKRMIDACKRWSQGTSTRVGVSVRLLRHVAVARASAAQVVHFRARVTQGPFVVNTRCAQAATASAVTITETVANRSANA